MIVRQEVPQGPATVDRRTTLRILSRKERSQVNRRKLLNAARLKAHSLSEDEYSSNDLIHPWAIEMEDSHLLPGPGETFAEGGDYLSFQEAFASVLPEGENIKDYVERVLSDSKGKVVGIEFGGPGRQMFRGFTPDFFLRTAGVTFNDHRPLGQKMSDVERRHSIITGNMFQPSTMGKVDSWLGGGKVNFVIERMIAGLRFVPLDLRTLSKAMRRAYALLDQETTGLMFIQIPKKFISPVSVTAKNTHETSEIVSLQDMSFYANVLRQWINLINTNFGSTLEVQFGKEKDSPIPVLRILKKPGAPTELPMLDLRSLGKKDF